MDDRGDVFIGARWQIDTRWNVDESRRRSISGLTANVDHLAIRIELVDINLNALPLFTAAVHQNNCVPQVTRVGAAGLHTLKLEVLTLAAT